MSFLRFVRFWCCGFASDAESWRASSMPHVGTVRFCPFTAPTFPEPIRSNPKLRAETCAAGPTGNTGLNGPCNTRAQHPLQILQIVAPCCTVLQCVAPCCTQKFLQNHCNTVHRYRSRQLAPTCTYLRQLASTCGIKIIFSGFHRALGPKPLTQRNACAWQALGLKTACKHNRTVRAEYSSARSIWKGNHVKRTR
jgi:hypothetical protein